MFEKGCLSQMENVRKTDFLLNFSESYHIFEPDATFFKHPTPVILAKGF
jgi:hypothetical protein